ncbi:MAG: type II secretion system F family protein [Phycisphaerales bacterium]|nr:MAG: type II secretion system F family protein [Phycisphaerales bacterium]
MPKYQYVAMDQSGQEVKDEIEAGSTEDALAKIRGMGYFPTRIKEKGAKRKGAAPGAKRKKGAGFSIGGVPLKALTQFTRQLSTLQDAGLPILRSLQILEQQQKSGLLKKVLGEVAGDVEGGATLSEAMAKHPKAFDRLYCNMVAAGEAGGVLDVILRRLADFMESAEKLKRKVKGAMVYPVAVILFALGIVTGIMITVVPKFKEIFKDFETGLPNVTLVLLKISDFVVGKKDVDGDRVDTLPGWIIILVSPVAFYLLLKLIRQSKVGSYAMDAIALRLPVLGQILGKTAVARFTRTLGTLIAAGVPILEALSITRETAGNAVFAKALGLVHDSIREGESFAQPLRASKVIDGLVINMIDVGEETGELDKMLYKVADNYDEEVDALVGSLVSLLEPAIVVVLGTIVGFIVIALFLPLVKLINSVTGGGA